MINVVVFAKGEESLLKTLSSILYQVYAMNYQVFVYKLEEFDESNYKDFPVTFYSHWKDLSDEIIKNQKNSYIYFVEEGDMLSSPFILSAFMDRFKDYPCDAYFGSYIFDDGGKDFLNHSNDMHHFFGKMYETNVFFRYFPKRFSLSNFFYLNYLLMWKKKVIFDSEFRNYTIGYDHYLSNDYWKQDFYQKDIIHFVSKLNKKSHEAYDLVISTLLAAYLHYLNYHEIMEKEVLQKMIPDEVSFSENNMDIIRSNETQILILCSSISFLDFLKRLKEDTL